MVITIDKDTVNDMNINFKGAIFFCKLAKQRGTIDIDTDKAIVVKAIKSNTLLFKGEILGKHSLRKNRVSQLTVKRISREGTNYLQLHC